MASIDKLMTGTCRVVRTYRPYPHSATSKTVRTRHGVYLGMKMPSYSGGHHGPLMVMVLWDGNTKPTSVPYNELCKEDNNSNPQKEPTK